MSNYLSPEWRQTLLDAGFPAEELNLGVAEEILRRLPVFIETPRQSYQIRIGKYLNGYEVKYEASKPFALLPDRSKSPAILRQKQMIDDTLANAAAAMWIYLKENNLLPETL